MDPASAFALSGTILQFLDTGGRFASLAFKIYRHGDDPSTDHAGLLSVTKDLDMILPKLQPLIDVKDSSPGLTNLALQCQRTTQQLLTVLRQIDPKNVTRKRDALKVAFRTLYKQDNIVQLSEQLEIYRSQLNMQLVLSLHEHISRTTEQQTETLRKLGISQKETSQDNGIASSIITHLISNDKKPADRAEDVKTVNDELATAFQSISTGEQAGEVHVSPADEERARTKFLHYLSYDGMIDRESRIVTAHESTFRWILPSIDTTSRPASNTTVTGVLADATDPDVSDTTITAVLADTTDPDAFVDGTVTTTPDTTIADASETTTTQVSGVNDAKWDDFRSWLESDKQLYWITGKAGSGKSTLMKFLSSPQLDDKGTKQTPTALESCRCHSHLLKWAASRQLIIAAFYFWNSGLMLQMSKEGLLRTLLHQIISQRPDILPKIAARRWESLCLFDLHVAGWTVDELSEVLEAALPLLRDDCRICFFIDGLDEFADDHEELVALVKNLIVDRPYVKVCVASRPWNIFQDALGQEASLRLEDLTFDDIKSFVRSKFHRNLEFENLRQRYPSFAEQLMDNIVVKASGVFLWVDLVVTSMLAGMKLGDRIQDFQQRLDELPPDLENLYDKILHSLDKFYLNHAAQYFALVERADMPLTVSQFSFADEESPESAQAMKIGSLTDAEMSLRFEACKRRLNSRCKGFLEIERRSQADEGAEALRSTSKKTVQYLHRTVRDFIKSAKAQEFLLSSTKPDFDPSMQLCVAYVMDLKAWANCKEALHTVGVEPHQVYVNVILGLDQAARVMGMNEGAALAMLDELRDFQVRKSSSGIVARRNNWVFRGPGAPDVVSPVKDYTPGLFEARHGVQIILEKFRDHGFSEEAFMCLAVRCNVVAYVRARAKWGGLVHHHAVTHDTDTSSPLLLEALSSQVPEPKMIQCLLDLGADPNLPISSRDSRTPWTVALTKITLLYTIQTNATSSEEYSLAEEKWQQTLRLLYTHGGYKSKVPETHLTAISRNLLNKLRQEYPHLSGTQSWARLGSWFRPFAAQTQSKTPEP